MSVQDLQDELIEDVLVAASALWDLYREERERDSENLPQPDPSRSSWTRPQAATFSLRGRSCIENISPKRSMSRHGLRPSGLKGKHYQEWGKTTVQA